MNDPEADNAVGLEERIKRLEDCLGLLTSLTNQKAVNTATPHHPAWPMSLGLLALGCGYVGLGLPQHYYQPLFAGLLLLLAYHRGSWVMFGGGWRWPLVLINFLVLCLLFKLLIGGGTNYPFDWLKVPTITSVPPAEDSPWYSRLLPEFVVKWRDIPLVSEWNVDMTKIQTLLLTATLAGALFRFQPFASLTALILLIISIPSFMMFNWDWVILFLILGAASIYLQSRINR